VLKSLMVRLALIEQPSYQTIDLAKRAHRQVIFLEFVWSIDHATHQALPGTLHLNAVRLSAWFFSTLGGHGRKERGADGEQRISFFEAGLMVCRNSPAPHNHKELDQPINGPPTSKIKEMYLESCLHVIGCDLYK
jgi:hypothetical protein